MSIKKRFLSLPTMGAMGMVVVGRQVSDSWPVLPNTGKQIYYVSKARAQLCLAVVVLRVRQQSLLTAFISILAFFSKYLTCLLPPNCPPRRSSRHPPSTSWKILQAQVDGALPSALETRAKWKTSLRVCSLL